MQTNTFIQALLLSAIDGFYVCHGADPSILTRGQRVGKSNFARDTTRPIIGSRAVQTYCPVHFRLV